MYKFHCGFRADKELLSSQQKFCGTTRIHFEIRNVNLHFPLTRSDTFNINIHRHKLFENKTLRE